MSIDSSQIDVLVVGAGPTGLTLAAALRARVVAVTVIDRLREGENTSRAAVVHARTLEALESLGVADRLAALGIHAQRFTIRDRDRTPADRVWKICPPAIPTPDGVAGGYRASAYAASCRTGRTGLVRPRALTDLSQDATGVTATLDDGSAMRARYLVGADGMHSVVE